jgi:predicted DNA-binding protein (MmcQ/YjbR family)
VASDRGTCVKTDSIETAALLIEVGHAVRAPYFHASWMLIPHGRVPDTELQERIATSYGMIRATLTRKAQADLG